jgi:hypothetical protein
VWWSIWSWERADRKACREEQAYWKEWRRRKLREWKLRGR